MRRFQKRCVRKGFTLVELTIVLAVIAVLTISIISSSGLRETARVHSAAESIRTLRSAIDGWVARGHTTFTGLSITALQGENLLPARFSATASNPWGGDYAVVPNANPTRADVSLTNVPAEADIALERIFNNSAQNIVYAGETWTVTF